MTDQTVTVGRQRRSGGGTLSHIRICDLTGQLAGAGLDPVLAAFGRRRSSGSRTRSRRAAGTSSRQSAPVRRRAPRHRARRRLQQPQRREARRHPQPADRAGQGAARRLVGDLRRRDGELRRRGDGPRWASATSELRAINGPTSSTSPTAASATPGPTRTFKSWGPIVQAVCGLTFASGLPDQPPAGWGYSYMDHTGANFMAIAILAALVHRNRTGEGQWVDMSCTEAGMALTGPDLLDSTVNGRRCAAAGMPTPTTATSRRWPRTASTRPRARTRGWPSPAATTTTGGLAGVIDEPWASRGPLRRSLAWPAGWRDRTELDAWSPAGPRRDGTRRSPSGCRAAGVPASAVPTPEERIDHDPDTRRGGCGPTVHHTEIGDVRVDGLPVHLSETDWSIDAGRPVPRRAQRPGVRRAARPRATTRSS